MIISKEQLLRETVQRLRAGKLFHAIIIEGSGAEKAAAEISAACVCTASDKPCGKCEACRKALSQSHADIHVSRGTGASKSIAVDEIRFVRDDSYIKPNEADRKIYILLGADNMNESSQNALLKVLEEPVQETLFILVCEKTAALLPTIISRCAVYDLGNSEALPADEKTVQLCESIMEALCTANEMELLALSGKLVYDKELFSDVLEKLAYVFYRTSISLSCSKLYEGAFIKLCDVLTFQRASRLYDITVETQEKLIKNANHALLVTAYFSAIYSARYGLEV